MLISDQGFRQYPPAMREGEPALFGAPDRRFRGASHLVSAHTGDTTVLMDPRRSMYFTLDEVGGRIWRLLASGSTVKETVAHLSDEYDVAPELLLRDIMATRDQLLMNRLIVSSETTPAAIAGPAVPQRLALSKSSAARVRVPCLLRCAWSLVRIKASLALLGFERTVGWIARSACEASQSNPATAEIVKRAERAVALAGAFYPGRARCLEQSLALYHLLRRQGIPVRYCQGVQCHPFQAHAWVEFHGEVVNDVPEHVANFCRFPDQLP
jgi:hypothetical protein